MDQEKKPSYEDLEQRIKELELLVISSNSSINNALLKASPDAIIISDFQGKILTLSEAATKLINLQQSTDAIGLKIFDFLEDNEQERAKESISQMFSGVFNGPEIYLAKRLDGRKLFIEVNGEFLRDEEGTPTQLIFIIRDVSSRQFAENELLKNHKFLTDLIENSGSIIYVKDLDGKYKLVNSKWEQATGINREKAIGSDDDDIFPSKLAFQFMQNDANVIKNNAHTISVETIFNLNENNHFISNNYPLKDEHDHVIGVCNFSADITELVSTKEELALVNTNLKKSIVEKDRFFSILAHDLRGPINGILALIEMVSEDFDEIGKDELRKMVSGMNLSATNVKRLLDNLLEWAGMQQGKIPYLPVSLNVASAIENAVNLSMNQAILKNQEIAFENNPKHQVLADSHMLDSILRNLISNAVKFTPKGGKITISAKVREDNKLQISIQDNGIGMDKATLPKLFLVDEKTNRKGTEGEPSAGLGLILCKDFVLKHGGEIWAESLENNGSTFHFTLPIS